MKKLFLLLLAISSTAGAAPFNPDTVVFLGSSTMEFWKPRMERDFPSIPTINLGQGGTTLDFLKENMADWTKKYPAKKFVLYSGDNDINNDPRHSAAQVASAYGKVLDALHARLPKAQIIVLSIKPRLAPEFLWSHEETVRANQMLKETFARRKNVIFVDTYPAMFNADRTPKGNFFREDGIHLNDEGYQLWRDILTPYLKK